MSQRTEASPHVVVLAGGVGGARLAAALQRVVPAGALSVIVNTGDDFEHWGLTVSPDLDTVLYNLAGVHNPATGWGRDGDTFHALEAMAGAGGEDWFRIGDRDLALHLRRSEWLHQGLSLTEITDRLRRTFGVQSHLLPMCDQPVRTLVHTDEGDLPFQHYFVRRRCEPVVFDLSYVGVREAQVGPAVRHTLHQADLVVIAPSNPYLSIDPILAVPNLRRLLKENRAPVVAVSPIVGGRALKGPAAKMMREMGQMPSPLTVRDHYGDLLDGFVLDQEDEVLAQAVGLPVLVSDTIMTSPTVCERLGRLILHFGRELAARRSPARTGRTARQQACKPDAETPPLEKPAAPLPHPNPARPDVSATL